MEYFLEKTVESQSFTVVNVTVSSEARIESCCYFKELCFSDYIEQVIVKSLSLQLFHLLV